MINNATWLNLNTRNRALNKLRKMRASIGALDTAMNLQNLEHYYSRLNFLPNDTFREMDRKLKVFNWQNKLHQSVMPGDFDDVSDGFRAWTFNSFCSFATNKISKSTFCFVSTLF
jgi:predicted metalloendopeptidase